MSTSNTSRHIGSGRIRTLVGTTVITAAIAAGGVALGAPASASTDDPTGLGEVFSSEIAEALESPRTTDQTGLGVIFSAEIAEALAPYAE